MKKVFLLSFAAAFVAALCFVFLPTGSANSGGKKEVTFNKDVAPIFFKNCAECHRPNDIAPMSLLNYKQARPWAKSIKEKVVSREMPPWSPDPAHGDFRNDKRLSQKDIDTIVAWVDSGAKEGNPKDLPPMPEMAKGGFSIGKPDVVLEMAEEYTVDPNAPDNYINFFIPTNFTEDKWIQAAEIHAGQSQGRASRHRVYSNSADDGEARRSRQSGRPEIRRSHGERLDVLSGWHVASRAAGRACDE